MTVPSGSGWVGWHGTEVTGYWRTALLLSYSVNKAQKDFSLVWPFSINPNYLQMELNGPDDPQDPFLIQP